MIKLSRRIYLASRSPRRKALLDQIGVAYEIIGTDLEEVRGENEPAADYVVRVAAAKAGTARAVAPHPWPIHAAYT